MKIVPPCTLITDAAEACKLVDSYLKKNLILGFDTETSSLDRDREILLWSFSDGEDRYCLTRSVLSKFRPLFEDPTQIWVMTNAKFDLHALANAGIFIHGPTWDTLVMDWLLDENRFHHGLKQCAFDHLQLPMKDFDEVFTRNSRKETLNEAIVRVFEETPEKAADYASLDAYASRALALDFYKGVLSNIEAAPFESLWDYYLSVEVPITSVLFQMELKGIKVDTDLLHSMEVPINKDISRIEEGFNKLVGKVINLRSSKQLADLLVNVVGLKPIKYTATGLVSTDEEALKKWGEQLQGEEAKIISNLLKHRSLSKLSNTYLKGLQKVATYGGRVHTTFNQTGTVTGRFSSKGPNIQNLPNPDKDKYGVRKAFVAMPGYILLDPDYDQLEMKIMAHFSEDEFMLRGIRDGLDMHCFVGSRMFKDATYEEYLDAKKAEKRSIRQKELKDQRAKAKMVGFGLFYGEGPVGLSKQLDCSFREAELAIDAYFDALPGVAAYIDNIHRDCVKFGHVRTLLGRYRRLSTIYSSDYGVRAMAARQAVNSTIQGSASEVVKLAMIKCSESPLLKKLNTHLLLQIHDELVFERPDDEFLEDAKFEIKRLLENPLEGTGIELLVPLTCTVTTGYNWTEAHQ